MAKATGFSFTNSKGVEYHLNTKHVVLRGGREQDIYFFTKDVRPETACELPEGYKVNENPRNGFLTVSKPKPAAK